jgi:predicted dehydrogenase
MTSVKWAMVGTGFMATLILKDFALSENTQLVALVSRDVARAEARLASEGIHAKALTFEQAIEDPEIDVIYIGTTHASHFELAKRALEAGKHVLVEKAFTMDAAEARELKRLAATHGRFIMEAMWTKFQPLHLELKRLVEAGRIGKLKFIESSFGTNPPYDANHRLFSHEDGGGSALDQGVYTTTFSHWYANSPLRKQTTIGELFPTGADASVHSTFEYENGVVAFAHSSLNTTLGLGARLVGDKGSIVVKPSFWNSEEAVISGPEDGHEHPHEVIHMPHRGAGYVHMIEAVSNAIIAGKLESEMHPLDFTIKIMEALDEARRQINEAAK